MRRRGQDADTFFTRDANGWTISEVPITINRSHSRKSAFRFRRHQRRWHARIFRNVVRQVHIPTATQPKKRAGRDSPKKTMSGFTRPWQLRHLGI
jgi:hypothetical protein